jgi:hypothetical protein
MAGGAEVPTLAGEGEEVLVPTGITADSSKPPREIATTEELLDNVADDQPVETILPLVPVGIGRFELGEVLLHALVEG